MASAAPGGAAKARSAFGLPTPREEARVFLDAGVPPLAPPVRGPLLGMDGFRQHARALAQAQPVERRRRWRRHRAAQFVPRLDDNLATLRRAGAYLQALAADGQPLGLAARELVEPLQRLHRRWPSLRAQVSTRTFRRLPFLRGPSLAGLPRIYAVAWSFVTHTDASFDANLLLQCLLAYQDVDELRIAELRALPMALQMVLLENIARLTEAIASRHAATEWADALVDAPTAPTEAALDRLHEAARQRGVAAPLLVHLGRRLAATPADEHGVLRTWLQRQDSRIEDLLAGWQAEEAADQVSLRHSVAALEATDHLDWATLTEAASAVLQRLSASEAFRREGTVTREQCLDAVARLARRLHRPEGEVAQRALDLADGDEASRRLGPAPFLIGERSSVLYRALGAGHGPTVLSMRHRCLLYIGGLVLGTLGLIVSALSGEALVPWAELLTVALLTVPASEVVLVLLQRLLSEFAPSRPLPRLALGQGLQPAQRSLVVVPCVLHSSQQVAALALRLEQHWLANREPHTQFALLSDWADAPDRQAAGDALLLDAARTAVAVLNARHPRIPGDDPEPRFLLLHRERSWSATESAWIGWDRARGQREQLLAHLAGATPSPFLPLAEDSRLAKGIVHLLTLEPETVMPPGALRELVSIAAHPMNAPRLDPRTRRVVGGYAVLQPHLAPAMTAERSDVSLTRDHERDGLPPADEVHQRLFFEARFSGEGLILIDAFHRATAGRVPEDRLPEASLYEGLWARCARVEDVTLLQAPGPVGERARAVLRRRTRHAWQLLPLWMQALHGRVGLVNLWKLLDGIRRSLLAPTAVALLWWSFTMHAVSPVRAVALVVAAYTLRPLLDALTALVPRRPGTPLSALLDAAARRLGKALLVALAQFTQLLQRALAELDAIARSIWRLTISRSHLLQATVVRRVPRELEDLDPRIARHLPTAAAALVFMFTGLVQPGSATPWLVGVGLWWLLAPALPMGHEWLQRRRLLQERPAGDERVGLQQLAQESWRSFSQVPGPGEHRLPPDRIEFSPRLRASHRSSPSTLGLALLATACAHRLGLIGTRDFVHRVEQWLQTLDRLPRYRGHLHDAIDTQTLRVLPPGRIDTVESGLLAACLWAVAQACREAAAGPAPHGSRELALQAALERLRHDGDPNLREQLAQPALQALLQQDLWALWRRDPARLRALVSAVRRSEAPGAVPGAVNDLLRQLDSLLQDREDDRDGWPGRLRELAARADGHVQAMDFTLLYDPHRRLLRTGHGVEDATPEETVHAALGSRARLASFVAIAKGDVPPDHWLALDRTLERTGDRVLLQAMHENLVDALLPALLLDEPPQGLLNCSARAAVAAAPPLSPDPRRPRTVAPWLTVLSLLAEPAGATARLQRLERLGARGPWGFIESLTLPPAAPDAAVTPQRSPAVVLRQLGAGIAAMTNTLTDDGPRRWFSGVPAVRAHLPLLQERLPDEGLWPAPSPLAPPTLDDAAVSQPTGSNGSAALRVIDPTLLPPAGAPTQWLGHARYRLALRPHGGGGALWLNRPVDRNGDDLLRDEGGHVLMLREGDDVEFHSLTRAPHPRPDAFYRTRFHEDRVEFDAECDFWRSTVTAWVSPDADAEFRQVSLQNLEPHPVAFELLSVLPLFGDLDAAARRHVKAHAPDGRTLLFCRPPQGSRRRDDDGDWLAHFVARTDLEPVSMRLIADRRRLQPRRGDASQMRPGAGQQPDAAGRLDTGFDPVAAIAVRVLVPANTRVGLTFVTALGSHPQALTALADEYRRDVHLQRARRMAAAVMRQQAERWMLEPQELHALQDLCTSVVAHRGRLRPASSSDIDLEVLHRRGIDPALPMLLVRMTHRSGVRAVQALRRGCQRWAAAGLPVSLVVVDAQVPDPARRWISPLPPLSHELSRPAWAGDAERLHVFAASQLQGDEIATLQSLARVDLVADGSPLPEMVQAAWIAGTPASRTLAAAAAGLDEAPAPPDRRSRSAVVDAPVHDAGMPWRFVDAGHGLRLRVDGQHVPPRAWQQVLGHREFGTVVTECGGGHTWVGPAREVSLTPARADAWIDPPVEHFLLQDEASREWWGLLPTLDRNGLQGYEVTHRPGASRFEHRRGELLVVVDVSVHGRERAKVLHVRLRNEGSQPRVLRAFGLAEWQLGTAPDERLSLRTDFTAELQACVAQAPPPSGRGTAFLALVGLRVQQWTCARDECFDALGRLRPPRALAGASGSGLDPCAALDAPLLLAPGAEAEFAWVMGHGDDRADALARAARLQRLEDLREVAALACEAARDEARRLQVHSPDPAFDALVNHWLPWQAWLDEQGLLVERPAGPAGTPWPATVPLHLLAESLGALPATGPAADPQRPGGEAAAGAMASADVRGAGEVSGEVSADAVAQAGPGGAEDIDLATQAALALSDPPGDERGRRALAAIDSQLMDHERHVLRGSGRPTGDADAPASTQPPVPAAWTLLAQALAGTARRAWETFLCLSPAHRALAAPRRYLGEPQAVPAWVVAAGPHAGEAGPGWATGVAGWLHRAAVEGLLGLVLREDRLCLAPCLPPHWQEVGLTLRWRGRVLQVQLRQGRPGGTTALNGVEAAAESSTRQGSEWRRLQPGEWIRLDDVPERSQWVMDLPRHEASPGIEDAGTLVAA